MITSIFNFFITFFFFSTMLITEAHSYIDPGTGSIILQAIIGGIAALGFTIKLYWYKIKSFFKKKNKNKE